MRKFDKKKKFDQFENWKLAEWNFDTIENWPNEVLTKLEIDQIGF
jgi:hypothetical protein